MFDLFFKITFQITSKQKWTKWNQILLAKRSCAGVSGPSDVPQFVRELMFRKPMGNQAAVRVLSSPGRRQAYDQQAQAGDPDGSDSEDEEPPEFVRQRSVSKSAPEHF